MTDRLGRLDDVRRQLAERLAALENDPDANERGGDATWSLKDVYAHIARWDEHAKAILDARDRGEPMLDDDYRLLNAKWVAEDEELSLEDGRERFERSFRDFRAALAAIDASRWDAGTQELVDSTIEHYEDHLRAPLEFEVAPGG